MTRELSTPPSGPVRWFVDAGRRANGKPDGRGKRLLVIVTAQSAFEARALGAVRLGVLKDDVTVRLVPEGS